MLNFIAPFLNPKALLWAIGGVLAIGLAWKIMNFIDEAQEAKQLIAHQEVVIQQLNSEISTMIFLQEQIEASARTADAARKEAENRLEEISKIRERARRSGDKEDGKIAPVLRDVLNSIGVRGRRADNPN